MPDDISRRIYDLYISRGLTPQAAAAMVGQAMAESGGDPGAKENGGRGPGRGLFQWTSPDRQAGLATFAKDRPWIDLNSLEGQVDYSLYELDNNEKAAGQRLYAAPDYPTAVNAATGFTRPAGYTPDNPAGAHNFAGRWNYGAGLAGAQPMVGPAMAAAGGSSQPVTGGLLAGGIDKDIADWSKMGQDAASQAALQKVMAADAAAKAGQMQAGMMAAKMGTEMMKPPPPVQYQQLREAANEPKELAPFPNFTAAGGGDFGQQLAQSRLLRRKRPGGM